jgi:hypothetical protein
MEKGTIAERTSPFTCRSFWSNRRRNRHYYAACIYLTNSTLGLQADAPNHRLYLDPVLPHWLPDIALRGLTVANCKLDLRFWREDDKTRWEILAQEGVLAVEEKSWQSWSV